MRCTNPVKQLFCTATWPFPGNLYRLVTVPEDYPAGHGLPCPKKLLVYGGLPMLNSIWAAIFFLPGGLDGGHLIQTGVSPNGTLLTAIAAFLLLLTKI
jgi:hypothetical protein